MAAYLLVLLMHALLGCAFLTGAFHATGVGVRPSPTTTTVAYNIVDIDESVERDVVAMERWAKACGVQRSDGFRIVQTAFEAVEEGSYDRVAGGADALLFSPNDFSVMTTECVSAGSPVLCVPADMVLRSRAVYQEIGWMEVAEDLLVRLQAGDQVHHFYLFLKILAEHTKGDESAWFPWLDSLPRNYTNGESMTPLCYKCLPPLAASYAMGERTRFTRFYEALLQVDIFPTSVKYDKDLARWAFQIVYTRGIDVNGELAIIPMADMFNHATEPEAYLNFDDDGNCYAVTCADISAHSPIRVSYGDSYNPSYLFARYGFLDDSSPATFCKIMVSNPSNELIDMGYDPSRMLFYRWTGEISEEVWDVLLFQVLELEADPSARNELYEAHMSGDVGSKRRLHEQFLAQTSMALKDHVDSFLKELDELAKNAGGKDVGDHPRLPLIMRHNEFVKTTFLAVKSQLDPLVEEVTSSIAW